MLEIQLGVFEIMIFVQGHRRLLLPCLCSYLGEGVVFKSLEQLRWGHNSYLGFLLVLVRVFSLFLGFLIISTLHSLDLCLFF